MKKNLITIFLFLLFFVAVGQQVYKLYFVCIQQNFVDYNVYVHAVSVALAKEDVYLTPTSSINAIPFNYPPTSLVFFLLLSIPPKTIAPIVFLLCSLGSLFLSIQFLCSMLFPKSKRLNAFLLSSIIFVQYFPVKFTLTLGQINLMILLLVVTAYFVFQKNKDVLSGFFLAAATLIKIFPIFLIFFFVKEKRWKTIMSLIGTLLCCLIVTLILFKPMLIYSYFGFIGKNLFLNAGDVSYFDQSLNSFLLRFHFTLISRLVFRALITVISLFVFLKTKDKMLSYFGLLFSILIFLPSFAWFHHYVILIPLLLIVWTNAKSRLEKILLVCVYVVTSFHFRIPELFPGPNVWLYSHPFFGACLLWFLAAKKAWGEG